MGYNHLTTRTGSAISSSECKAEIKEAKADLILELSKGIGRFQSALGAEHGHLHASRLNKDLSEEELGRKETSVKKARVLSGFALAMSMSV